MDAMLVFDRTAVRRHRDRAAATVGSVEDLLRDWADRLLDRLDDMTGTFSLALDIGGRGVVAPLLQERGITVVSTDLSLPMARLNALPVVADEEFLPFAPGSFDLVVASLALHWINDLPGALIQLRRVLRPRRVVPGLDAGAWHAGGTAHSLDRGGAGSVGRGIAQDIAVSGCC